MIESRRYRLKKKRKEESYKCNRESVGKAFEETTNEKLGIVDKLEFQSKQGSDKHQRDRGVVSSRLTAPH